MHHKFHLGQLVRVAGTSGAVYDNRTYCIVSLLTSSSEAAPMYRIKNAAGIEHLVKSNEIEPAALTAMP